MNATARLSEIARKKSAMPGGYTTRGIAQEIEAEYPELVSEWLQEAQSILLLGFVIDDLRVFRHRVTRNANHAERKSSIFDAPYAEVGKCLGDMDGSDHLFVADCRASDKRAAAFQEELHRAIASRIGKSITRDVYTEDELQALFAGAVKVKVVA